MKTERFTRVIEHIRDRMHDESSITCYDILQWRNWQPQGGQVKIIEDLLRYWVFKQGLHNLSVLDLRNTFKPECYEVTPSLSINKFLNFTNENNILGLSPCVFILKGRKHEKGLRGARVQNNRWGKARFSKTSVLHTCARGKFVDAGESETLISCLNSDQVAQELVLDYFPLPQSVNLGWLQL